jgi:hypothetical protein
MTATLAEIADEIAATLEDAIQIEGDEIDVYPRLNLSPQGFCIDVYPAAEFRAVDGAGFTDETGIVNWVVRARINGDRDAEQDLLLRLMDEEDDLGVAAVLMDDQTLNGLASSVRVTGPSGYTQYLDAGAEGTSRFGVEWLVTVLRAYS